MDRAEVLKRLDKKTGVIIRYDDKGHAYVSAPVGRVPLKQFEEWQGRVDREFGGSRWAAIWNDYLRAQTFDARVEAEMILQEQKQEEKVEEEVEYSIGLLNGEE